MKYLYKKRLVELREEMNIKQYTLAQLLGFHNNAYGQFEREDTIIPIIHLNTLCIYFNVSIDYVFGFTDMRQYNNSNNNIDMTLSASRIKEFRKENKLTQLKLAEMLKADNSTISKYEKAKNVISTTSLYEICKKYNISADYLLGKVDEPKYLK